MKCKILEFTSTYELERAVTNFISNYDIFSVSYATTKHGYNTYYSALIIYR